MPALTPYIGITDFRDPSEVRILRSVFDRHKLSWLPRLFHVGVMTSYKVMNGLETKWARAFPPKEKFVGLFSHRGVYNCLHYADYEHNWGFVDVDIRRAIANCGFGLHALQLDMVWPDERAIMLATSGMELEVILQINKVAMEEVGNDPKKLVKRLRWYEGVVHRVLLDKSGGQGLPLVPEELLPYARAIREKYPDLGIGFAGGLGPKSLEVLDPILDEFPDASFDSQAKVHLDGDPLKALDINAASEYIGGMFRKISSHAAPSW